MKPIKTVTAAASEAQKVVFAKRFSDPACGTRIQTFTPYCGCKANHLSTCNLANRTTWDVTEEANCKGDYFTCKDFGKVLCGDCYFGGDLVECLTLWDDCIPSKLCTRPIDSTGYVITGFEQRKGGLKPVLMTDLLIQYFEKVGIHHSCATGYSGTPTVTLCAEPGLPYILSGCKTTTTTTTTSCSQVTCGLRCLSNATVNNHTTLPNCWYHNGKEACNDLVGYDHGTGPFPCSLLRPSLECRANLSTPC